MNIFVTDLDPKACAQVLDDKRVIKMILESAQMLSTALHAVGAGHLAPYKPTHVNHPCSIWARESSANYFWLLEHMQFLCMEYQIRYNKIHKCANYLHDLFNARHCIPKGELTPFANCTPHKNTGTFDAYKLTLKDKWVNDKRPPTWKSNTKPSWA